MRLPSIPVLLALVVSSANPSWAQAANPSDATALWNAIKTGLLKGGDEFFESSLKDALIPGQGVHSFLGTVIASRPAEHPTEFVLAISDKIHPEVTLKLRDTERREDHFKGPAAPGAKIAFAGVVTAFEKNPFMLTIEAGAGDRPGLTFAVIMEPADSTPMPSLSVNYPSRLSTRFVSISLNGLPLHKFTVSHHGSTTEMSGVRLERFLTTAGWHGDPSNSEPHFAVEIHGRQMVVTLDVLGKGSFEKQTWLVPAGGNDSNQETALVVVNASGTLIQRVDGIQRIWVSEKK
jgi:hypothetical protein